MPRRPSVLLVEPETEHRRELGRALSEFGYEVVPAVGVEEGLRFAEGLGPAVIVASAELDALAPEADGVERLSASRGLQSLLLLGSGSTVEDDLPEEVLFVPAGGLTVAALVRKIRVALIGREIGIAPDARLEALVGDLVHHPPLELVRTLHDIEFTGRLAVEAGEILFSAGTPVAAQVGKARGLKAFCRLGRLLEGVFRIWPEAIDTERELTLEVEELVIRAVEDASVGEFPPPRTRVRLEMGDDFFSGSYSERQQRILTAAHAGTTVGALLDAFPATDGAVLEDLTALAGQGVVRFEEPESRVRVVTDSTADLPLDVARRLGIEVVPLSVIFGEERFQDGVTLKPRRFYELLEEGSAHPTTEPPAVETFRQRFEHLLGDQDVVSVHISSELSETFAHAATAADATLASRSGRRDGGEPVEAEVVDSRLVSLSLGLLVVFAARMALRGQGASAIAERLPAIASRIHTFFVVDTLEYLARGGRIGKARALIGEMLRIKPILSLEEGEVGPVARVRGGRAAHPKIVELLGERLGDSGPLVVGIAHANAAVWADRLRRLLEESFPIDEMMITEIGPVVGTHAGPGTVGVVAFEPTGAERELLAPIERRG